MPTQADNMIVRTQSIKVHDDGEQQKLEMHGRFGERYGGSGGTYGTPRIQSYGFTSHPPAGSQGTTVTPDGNPDKAMCIGMEHPQHRPKNLAEGEFKLYTKFGTDHYGYAQSNKWIWKVGSATIEWFADGKVHINRSGA